MPISTTFDTDGEGWTASNGTETHVATGGNGGGYLYATEGGSGLWGFLAPTSYLGDQESYYGGTLSFDMFQPGSASQLDEPDIILTGGGITLVIDAGPNPGTTWTSYSVDLELGGGWRVGNLSGAVATEAQIRTVLADLTSFEIRGEFVNGSTDDASGLDNVALTEGTIDPGNGSAPVITSTFDTDIDGWAFIADVAEFRQVATGGNPGGYLEAVDYTTGETWYFVAPDKFLGDKSAFYGGTLAFDLQQSSTSSQFSNDDIILTGGGLTIVLAITHPGTSWTSYSLDLSTADDWRIGSEAGAVATEAEIRTVLGSLNTMHIRGEYVSGSDTGGLDNVVMTAAQNVELYDGASLLGSFMTLEEAIAAASPSNRIEILTSTLPTTSPGAVPVTVDDLTISAGSPYAETLQLAAAVQSLSLSGTAAFQAIGSGNDDTISGGSGNDIVAGGGGNDVLGGNAGADRLYGDHGWDALYGGGGNDFLRGAGGNDTLNGGVGFDTADYVLHSYDMIVNLNYGATVEFGALVDTLIDIEGVNAGTGNDIIVGNAAGNILRANSGNDQVYGLAGADILYGDAGNDTIEGSGGNDTMFGGTGLDALSYYNAAGGVTVNLGYQGNAQDVGGSMGIDVFTGFENLYGSRYYDDVLVGDGSANVIVGYDGLDALYGAGGNDQLFGMKGADTLVGGGGADTLTGGGGHDLFVFNAVAESTSGARDTITDFDAGIDMIQLTAIDADSGTAGDQAFAFIGAAAFSGTAGELRAITNNIDVFVLGDVDGDGVEDIHIRLAGITSVDSADFYL